MSASDVVRMVKWPIELADHVADPTKDPLDCIDIEEEGELMVVKMTAVAEVRVPKTLFDNDEMTPEAWTDSLCEMYMERLLSDMAIDLIPELHLKVMQKLQSIANSEVATAEE